MVEISLGQVIWTICYLGRLWDEFDELGRIDDVGCWIDSLLNVLKHCTYVQTLNQIQHHLTEGAKRYK
jgi:hypothetical protein